MGNFNLNETDLNADKWKYYFYKGKLIISREILNKKSLEVEGKNIEADFVEINEFEAENFAKQSIFSKGNTSGNNKYAYFFKRGDIRNTRRSFIVSTIGEMLSEIENVNLLNKECIEESSILPTENKSSKFILMLIENEKLIAVNINFKTWEDALFYEKRDRYKINVVGLGDVGGTLLTGLRLLGSDTISSLGIFDKNKEKSMRWEMELSQILSLNQSQLPVEINILKEEELFDCDVFVFCVSVSVPEVESKNEKEKTEDVRMVQFESNAKIISEYAKQARDKNFKGIFAVVSDPVDLLCATVYNESNTNSDGEFDAKGLAPEQIRGFGLGVMNARAVYYASLDEKTKHYLNEGRAFGPHGEGLIIIDSLNNYNQDISDYLTYKAKTSNLEIRSLGFKPYIAPSLSSGALSILDMLNENWNYSSSFIDGVFFGSKNKTVDGNIIFERNNLNEEIMKKIEYTHKYLKSLIRNK
ncbi:MAG: lactate dehydrogenase [Clostridioides sp.]|nr:lactate dehydrogenase [Clostridioides sp.]